MMLTNPLKVNEKTIDNSIIFFPYQQIEELIDSYLHKLCPNCNVSCVRSLANFVSSCANIFARIFFGLYVAYFKYGQLILVSHDHILALLEFLAIPAAATRQEDK